VPEPSTVTLEVPLEGGWLARCRLAPQGGRVVIAELHLVPEENVPAGGVTAGVVRNVQVGELRRELERHLADVREKWGDAVLEPEGLLGRHGLAKLAEEASRPAERDDAYFARIAARYVELVERGNTRPTPVLAAELGRLESYIAMAIRDARKRGLLTPTTRGRAGGKLTPKAQRLLARAREEE
jgi:hypothetical protein